jgi:hypothetical protein
MKQEGSTTKKRISFLMPYIDFCFMLIIIFAGMLSIAYFEPLGRTDIQNKKASELNKTQGKYEINPIGIQESNVGLGEEMPGQAVRPLEGRAGGSVRIIQAGRPNERSLVRPARGAARAAAMQAVSIPQPQGNAGAKPNSYVNPAELDKMKKQLDEQKSEIEQLKKTQGAPGPGGGQPAQPPYKGDSYYIDLRQK